LRKEGAGRFILGIEGLTALVTGASALVAFVAALVLWIMVSDARSTIESSAMARAGHISEAMGSRPSQEALESLVRATVPGGGVRAVAVTGPSGIVAAYPTMNSEELESSSLITVSGSSGTSVILVMELSPVLSQGRNAVMLLASFGVMLTLVAVMVPSYLRRRVLEPLRGILGQADRVEKGSGRSAESAGDSFRKLVDLLAAKDAQLEEMRLAALRRAETAESRSFAVLEAMGSAVALLDDEMVPALWNTRAEELLGGSVSLREMIPENARNGEGEWDGEIQGRTYRFRLTRGTGGERVLLATDVTASIAMERRLAEESALADLGALSAGVAHEIGNALCALEGFIALLGRGSAGSRTEKILEEAQVELGSAKRIVDSFREMAQQNRIESTISSREAAGVLRNECEGRRVGFHGSGCEKAETVIPGNPVIYARILSNLLENSLRYSDARDVSVEAECSGMEGFTFRVTDMGPGLPQDTETVFRPMYTTEGHRGGMGLGLTITRRLVRAMGGSVHGENHSGGGAVFTVRIPPCGEGT